MLKEITNYNNQIIQKNPSSIEIKVPDMEWKTTGRNVRPPASNENPELWSPRAATDDAKTVSSFQG